MRLGELIADAACRLVDAQDAGVRVTDVTEDSRSTMPGSLFVARPGLKVDGRAFIGKAIEDGASAVLTDEQGVETIHAHTKGRVAAIAAEDVALAGAQIAERFFGGPSNELTVVATTGTNGKTSVTHFAHGIQNASGVRCGQVGTVLVDDGERVVASEMTTPPATEMSQTLAAMVENECEAVSLEASSHALSQKRLSGIDIDVALFTNLTGDHLDYHGTMEDYAAAKAVLFEQLTREGLAVVNAADPWAERMVRDCAGRVLRAGVVENGSRPAGSGLDVSIRVVGRVGNAGRRRVRLELVGGSVDTELGLLGSCNLLNVLLASAAAEEAGASLDGIGDALAGLEGPAGRLEPVSIEGVVGAPVVLVDYAHTDDALTHALAASREVVGEGGSLWVVFGCGGDRDTTKRPRMGLAACAADRLVITSDNPRSEKPSAIITQVLAGVPGERRGDVAVHADREEAIRAALGGAGAGDVVVIAGKGHETEQIAIEGGVVTRRVFDDRVVAHRALLDRYAGGAAAALGTGEIKGGIEGSGRAGRVRTDADAAV